MTNIEPNTTLQDRNPKENFGAHHKGVPSDAMTPEVDEVDIIWSSWSYSYAFL